MVHMNCGLRRDADELSAEVLPKSKQRQEIRRQHRLRELLRVASRQFTDKGYEATTLEMIADEMGLTKTGLYNYVNSKEEIAALILENAITHLSQTLEHLQKEYASPRDILHGIVLEHVKSLANHPASPMLVMRFDQVLDPQTFPALYELRHRYENQVQDVIALGIAQGQFSVDDPKLATLFLLGAVNWVARWYHSPTQGTPLDATHVGQWFAEVIVGGLTSPDRLESSLPPRLT